MQKITPFLWFNDNAEDAANFYTSIFKNSKVTNVMPGPKDTVAGVSFTLDGQQFMSINGGPHFQFTEAISMFVSCADQAEVDYFWDKLSEGGSPSQCGWLKDKFGLSWQIIPTTLSELLGNPDREKAGRAMQAMLTMTKIDIAKLQEAFEG